MELPGADLPTRVPYLICYLIRFYNEPADRDPSHWDLNGSESQWRRDLFWETFTWEVYSASRLLAIEYR